MLRLPTSSGLPVVILSLNRKPNSIINSNGVVTAHGTNYRCVSFTRKGCCISFSNVVTANHHQWQPLRKRRSTAGFVTGYSFSLHPGLRSRFDPIHKIVEKWQNFFYVNKRIRNITSCRMKSYVHQTSSLVPYRLGH